MTEYRCGRIDRHPAHEWSSPVGGPYACPGEIVVEMARTRCPGCGTAGPPHDVGGEECRESAREKAISQGDE